MSDTLDPLYASFVDRQQSMKYLATVYATRIRGSQNEKQYCFARMDRLTVRYSGLGAESTKLELTAIIPKMFWAHFYWSKR